MKKNIFFIGTIINAVVAAVYLALTPQTSVPTHYGINGYADSYGSKWTFIIAPLILVAFAVVYIIFCAIIKCKNKSIKNEKYLFTIVGGILTMLCAIFWVITVMAINCNTKMSDSFMSLVLILLGLLMVFISNLMPKVKQNSFLGIKTYSTLSSENVWKKTHRLGAYTGVIGGVCTVICGLLGFAVKIGEDNMALFIIGISIMIVTLVIIPVVYANRLYRAEKREKIK